MWFSQVSGECCNSARMSELLRHSVLRNDERTDTIIIKLGADNMLQSIREHTHGWIAGIIVSLLILSFALWGIHSYIGGGANDNIVATVNGVQITKSQLGVEYDRLRRQMQMQGTVNTGLSEQKLKEQALQTLVNTQVLSQASQSENYFVSTNQIDNFLESMPEFQVDGVFSMARFQQALSTTLFTARDFFDLIKTSLLIDQPRLGLLMTSFSLPNEVDGAIALVEQQRNIRYLVIPKQYFLNKPIVITDEAIRQYYAQHQNDFKSPEQVSIEYITLSLADVVKTIQPSENAMKDYYRENANAFVEANSNSKVSKQLPYDSVKAKIKDKLIQQQAEEKFADLREKLANVTYEHPESLVQASKALSLPVQSSGLFSRDSASTKEGVANNSKVRDIAFSNEVLNLQNNSDVIALAPDQVVVIRVKSHQPASLLALDVVKQNIIDRLKQDAIENQLRKMAQNVVAQLQRGSMTADAVASQYHLSWVRSGWVGRHASTVNPAVLDLAFEMPRPKSNNKESYASTKLTEGYAIVALSAIQPGKIDQKANSQQYQAYSDQIQNANGSLEYALYQNSLTERAKITY